MNEQIEHIITDVTSEISGYLKGTTSEHYSSNYCEVHSWRYRYDIKQICELVPPGAAILDFGAWPFIMAESLARIGYNLQAADIHPELCTYKEALSFAIMKADANAASLPIESELFDLVVMTEVFEHLYLNPIVTMREIMRILRPGGFLYLTTPNGLGLRKLVKVARKGRFQDIYQQWKNLEETGLMGHVHEYSPREVGEFIKDCGYADVTTKTANVYRKGVVENLFWRAMTTPLISMRENIICIARKPL